MLLNDLIKKKLKLNKIRIYAYLFFRAFTVLGVVNFLISPLSSIISLTKFEDIIWFSISDIKNIVSILLFNFLFIPANWYSYSKSETAKGEYYDFET